MIRAKVYLTNGEVADVNLDFPNIVDWVDSIATKGIQTEDSYIPHHSIYYILFESALKKITMNNTDILEKEVNIHD